MNQKTDGNYDSGSGSGSPSVSGVDGSGVITYAINNTTVGQWAPLGGHRYILSNWDSDKKNSSYLYFNLVENENQPFTISTSINLSHSASVMLLAWVVKICIN